MADFAPSKKDAGVAALEGLKVALADFQVCLPIA